MLKILVFLTRMLETPQQAGRTLLSSLRYHEIIMYPKSASKKSVIKEHLKFLRQRLQESMKKQSILSITGHSKKVSCRTTCHPQEYNYDIESQKCKQSLITFKHMICCTIVITLCISICVYIMVGLMEARVKLHVDLRVSEALSNMEETNLLTKFQSPHKDAQNVLESSVLDRSARRQRRRRSQSQAPVFAHLASAADGSSNDDNHMTEELLTQGLSKRFFLWVKPNVTESRNLRFENAATRRSQGETLVTGVRIHVSGLYLVNTQMLLAGKNSYTGPIDCSHVTFRVRANVLTPMAKSLVTQDHAGRGRRSNAQPMDTSSHIRLMYLQHGDVIRVGVSPECESVVAFSGGTPASYLEVVKLD